MSSLYEACRASLRSICGDIDCNIDSVKAAVLRQILRLSDEIIAVGAWTQLTSVSSPLESDSGAADPRGSSGPAS